MIQSKHLIRPFLIVAAALPLMIASQAQAGFILTENSISITSVSNNGTFSGTTVTFGGTIIGLNPISPQTFQAGSGANVIDVAAQSSSAITPDTGSFTFSENFTLTGTTTPAGNSAGFVETVTLTGTFNLIQGLSGAIISNMGSPSNGSSSLAVTVNSGSGFSFSSFGYTQPSPNSSVANPTAANDGNVSLTIIPTTTTVPEPASLAMFSMGLIGVGVFTRRRLVK
jgi:hypothetical protein